MKGRFLDCTLGDPFSNVALEEALFALLKEPVLRVWDNQKSVVIGRAQLADAETDLELCRATAVPVVRRFTAGGAVYNGPGNVNWSFLEPRPAGPAGSGGVFDAGRIFSSVGETVVKALGECGVESWFKSPNSILARGGKISGMAAYISARGSVCHGTLLANADLDEVERYSKPAAGVVEARYPRSIHVTVANCGVERGEFVWALARVAGMENRSGEPTSKEAGLAGKLCGEKYSKDSWNLGDPFGSDHL